VAVNSEPSTDRPGIQSLRALDLGRLAYEPALAEQRRVNQAVIDGHEPPTLLLVEHDPVITVSHRRGAASHILAPPQRLAELGIAVHETDRGGDVTYHGPGQLVAYPILRLHDHGLNLSRYMRLLEAVVIDAVATWGVEAHRDACATGVWVGQAKLCALGVRVRKNVTMHGLALNVRTDLSHFQTIVPCGLTCRAVTSLAQLLGDRCPTMDATKRELTHAFRRALKPGYPQWS
jgi:lipoyl(octanoyl) transferase